MRSGSAEFSRLNRNTRHFLEGWSDFVRPFTGSHPFSPDLALFKKLCRYDPLNRNSGQIEKFNKKLKSIALDVYTDLKSKSESFHDFMIRAETAIQLPSLLHMEDRASMRYSLETRVPFCTASVLDLASRSRLEWKFYNGQPKGALRDIFGAITPLHISERRQKVGRPIPFRRWLQEKNGGEYLRYLVGKKELFREITEVDFIEYALANPNPYDRSAWAALSISKWIDLYKIAI